MAIHLIIIGLLFALMIGSFLYSQISGNKIFLLVTFLLLMFSGVLIQSSNGVIIEREITPDDSAGGWSYTDLIVTMEDSSLYMFSQICFWVGLVASAWIGLVGAFGSSKPQKSPFGY